MRSPPLSTLAGAGVGLALLVAACGDGDGPPPARSHASQLRVRIAVADLRAPSVTFYDAADREIVGRVQLEATARSLIASQSGDTALAVPEGGGLAQVVGGGVAVIPHKDHVHIFKSPPEVLGEALRGAGSVVATSGDGAWGVFFGGDAGGVPASARSFGEAAWVRGAREPVDVASTPSHRGFVVPFDGEHLVSRAPPAGGDAGGLADGVELAPKEGDRRGLFACARIVAAASAGAVAAFACDEGVVLVSRDRTASPPIALPDGMRAATLHALAGGAFLLARDEAGRVATIDVGSRAAAALALDSEACDAVLEIATEPRAVVLTPDGRVSRFDLATGRRLLQVEVTAPFACGDAERPRVAATPGRAWVTSPATGELHEIDTDRGVSVRRIAVGGTPGPVAVQGLDARDADIGLGTDSLSD